MFSRHAWGPQEQLVEVAERHGVRLSLFHSIISLVNFWQWV